MRSQCKKILFHEKSAIALIFLTAAFLFTAGCGDNSDSKTAGPSASSTTTISNTVSNSSPQVFNIDTSGNSAQSISYDLDIGSAARSVFFIFSNISTSATASMPSISGVTSSDIEASSDTAVSAVDTRESRTAIIAARNKECAQTVIASSKSISKSLNNLFSLESSVSSTIPSVGSTASFYVEDPNKVNSSSVYYSYAQDYFYSLGSTCRAVNTYNGKTVAVYVDSSVTDSTVTAKAQAVADKFIKNGSDIYTWDTSIFGAEWGSTSYTNLISESDIITILLYDIDFDKSTDGGTVGYYWAKDNFLTSSYKYSNNQLMFYIDWPMYSATLSSESSWTDTGYWAEEIYSTLAHEFQHMINFYQQSVLRNLDPGTWYNEMCSMMAEDLVADKLGVIGPRGVSDIASAGTSANEEGRIPLFNLFNYTSVVSWSSSSTLIEQLKCYSALYSFGAWMGRNYGGANLFHDLVQSSYTDTDGLLYAVNKNGGNSETFETLLRKWGAAYLLSDQADTSSVGTGYVFNGSSAFSSSLNSLTFNLGPINCFNYKLYSTSYGYNQTGPKVYSSLPSSQTLAAGSNIYFAAAASVTGSQSWDITLPANVKLTVVVK
jgi:hypothetical protein